ncbi:MAG TPA: hypothetical protein VFU22_18115 [Roseiflexaceae bacterium]|nr:hypothetical protein [Roseiflexaceae bacterium]
MTDTQVNEWIDALILQKHQRDEGRTLDPYSIRNAFALLRMAFNMAIPKLITINPCKGVKLPRPDDEEIHPLTAEQVNVLLDFLEIYVLDKASGDRRPHRLMALYHIAIDCGLRQGELFGLRWLTSAWSGASYVWPGRCNRASAPGAAKHRAHVGPSHFQP